MAVDTFRFEKFLLDPVDRRLSRNGEPVELNARYLDALLLLVAEKGRLVSKERFLQEVWRGVPVTDEALTQCIRTLRQRLGDEVANPRFIETVPKHGYRFIAQVECASGHELRSRLNDRTPWREFLLLILGGTLGGGLAGILGGLFYGFIGAFQPGHPGIGAISVLLVVLFITMVIALIGAAGVSLGISATVLASRRFGPLIITGGALGGFAVGGMVKLFGLDAFTLLIGWSPGDITGPMEGLILGGGAGIGAFVAESRRFRSSLRRRIAIAAISGAGAGALVAVLGGRLMGGSLELLVQSFPGSHLHLDRLGGVFGEQGFGPVTRTVTCVLEGMTFCACVVGAMALTSRGRLVAALDDRRTH